MPPIVLQETKHSSLLGPGRTKWCWAGTGLEQSLAGSSIPGRELLRALRDGSTTGPPQAGYVTERQTTFIHFGLCWSARWMGSPPRTASRLTRAGAIFRHKLPDPSRRFRIPPERHGGCDNQRDRHRTAGAAVRVSLPCLLFPSTSVCCGKTMVVRAWVQSPWWMWGTLEVVAESQHGIAYRQGLVCRPGVAYRGLVGAL